MVVSRGSRFIQKWCTQGAFNLYLFAEIELFCSSLGHEVRQITQRVGFTKFVRGVPPKIEYVKVVAPTVHYLSGKSLCLYYYFLLFKYLAHYRILYEDASIVSSSGTDTTCVHQVLSLWHHRVSRVIIIQCRQDGNYPQSSRINDSSSFTVSTRKLEYLDTRCTDASVFDMDTRCVRRM